VRTVATPREQLADILRKSRIDAGYASHGALARKLNVSRPVITKAENPAHPVPSDAILAAWAGATGAGLDVITDLAQRAKSGPPGWFAKWADDIEARATMIRWFEPLLVPGLLQTESYARAVLAWKPESASAEVNLTNRLARQSVLDRAELRVVILESVLNREVGDAATMCEQVQHLLAVGSRPSVVLQVVLWEARSRSRPRARPMSPRTRNRSSKARCIPMLTWSRALSACSMACARTRYRGHRPEIF
jgi:hypothetical protein